MKDMCKTEMELHESRIGNDVDIYWLGEGGRNKPSENMSIFPFSGVYALLIRKEINSPHIPIRFVT